MTREPHPRLCIPRASSLAPSGLFACIHVAVAPVTKDVKMRTYPMAMIQMMLLNNIVNILRYYNKGNTHQSEFWVVSFQLKDVQHGQTTRYKTGDVDAILVLMQAVLWDCRRNQTLFTQGAHQRSELRWLVRKYEAVRWFDDVDKISGETFRWVSMLRARPDRLWGAFHRPNNVLLLNLTTCRCQYSQALWIRKEGYVYLVSVRYGLYY